MKIYIYVLSHLLLGHGKTTALSSLQTSLMVKPNATRRYMQSEKHKVLGWEGLVRAGVVYFTLGHGGLLRAGVVLQRTRSTCG